MSLVLTIGWSIDSVAVKIFDVASDSRVAEGNATVPAPTSSQSVEAGIWYALCAASHAALDELAVLNLAVSDIRSIQLFGDVPVSVTTTLCESLSEATRVRRDAIGELSSEAAAELGLVSGCRVERSAAMF